MELGKFWAWFVQSHYEQGHPRTFATHAALIDKVLKRFGYEAFFIFLEDYAPVIAGEGIDAPNAATLRADDLESKDPQRRYRASGVSAPGFMRSLAELFADDLTRDRSDERRERRLGALMRYFEEEPVRRFDIYVTADDEGADGLAQILQLTSWSFALLGRDRPGGVARRVIMTLDDADRDEDYQLTWLHRLGRVSPPITLRLRDIFSLNHIRDAGLGLGGEGPPPGGSDGGGGTGRSSDWTGDRRWAPGGAALSR